MGLTKAIKSGGEFELKTKLEPNKTKTGKVIEILNPEEVDEKGISQTIEGTTLFGKKIPSTSYSVEEGKTYGRQRQILKKGESLYSIQQTKSGLSLEPAPFRKEKDVADFYALAKSAQEVEFPKGSPQYERLEVLLKRFKNQQDFDVEEYLKKNKTVPERVTLTTEKSSIQRTGSSLSTGSVRTASVSSPLSKSVSSVRTSSLSGKRSTVSIINKPKSLTRSLSNSRNSIQNSLLTKPSTLTRPSISNGKSLSGKSISGKSSASLGGGKSLGTPRGGGKSSSTVRVSLTSRQQTMMETKKKAVAPIFILSKDKTDKTKGFKDRNYNFLGNTRVAEVSGFRTKKE